MVVDRIRHIGMKKITVEEKEAKNGPDTTLVLVGIKKRSTKRKRGKWINLRPWYPNKQLFIPY